MLHELTASTKRLALVGLAKNTGKTVALAALLRELEQEGLTVGVTSVGRDGEEHDVIDARISKPRVRLPAGSLLATTDALLRASSLPYELLEQTGVRTPLGQVLIARLDETGTIEVAGPSAGGDVRSVSDAMLHHGAAKVLIDGAVDRRAASSPDVADGLLMSTGAVLSDDIAEVVLQTKDAIDLVRLPIVDDIPGTGERLRALAHTSELDAPGGNRGDMFVSEDFGTVVLPPRFILTSDAEQIAQLLDQNPGAHWLIVKGALPDRFLRGLVHPLHHRKRELVLVVASPTSVFLWKRGPEWYSRQGIHLRTFDHVALEALTVNPVAPQSHSFDSAHLRALLEETIEGVPIFDVLDPSYAARRQPAPLT